MTAQLLASELNNLIQESKRKHNDLRQAAEKSLEELKSLRGATESQVAAELGQKINFVNPFIIACGTKNAKFTGIAIVCLQRLIVSKALPRSKLSQVLEALQQATSAGLDVQLKILQALPSLLSNYASDIKGDLLVTALSICFVLQSSKNAIVNNTSAATLQQLVVSIFDKVVAEDKSGTDAPFAGEAPTQDGTIQLKQASLDAYRVFYDLCLLTESKRPEYLRFSGLPQTFGLELIESVLTNHAAIFSAHAEQTHILRTRVMPFIIETLKGKPNFATSVRLVRILYTLLRRHLSMLPTESGDALDILTQLLDQDTHLWKRSLCMEVFRGIFAEPGLIRRIFSLYDAREGQKKILKNITATFVRVSTEKPGVIGLGHQSTIPAANPYSGIGSSTDQAMLEASGVAGIISGSVSGDTHNTGISTQWSSMRVPCIDQLDKTEPPPIPESYLYSLVLSCITSLSEGLAKFILPLTVPGESRRKRSSKPETERDSPAPVPEEGRDSLVAKAPLERSASFKKNPVPVNPLTLEDHPNHAEVKICADFIDECWPAILATCSTFLYAALDSEYYHGLVRAFQKFAHVAGLLQLNTPRDAFLTTLGKSAVPPNVFTACLNAGTPRPATPETPNSLFNNARGLLSVDSLVSQGQPSLEKQRQQSVDTSAGSLNTRNMLCLRALLNLGIALGPTLSSSWRIILETLQQADFVLFSSGKVAGRTPTAAKNPDQQADQEATLLLSNFGTEVRAVETAATRLFESTIDFPNSAFVEVVAAVCNLLEKGQDAASDSEGHPQSPPSAGPPKRPSVSHRRVLSISTAAVSGPNQEDQFALAKLGDLASINMERLMSYPPDVSGWSALTSELISTMGSTANNGPVRGRAAETVVRLVLEAAAAATSYSEERREIVQRRILELLRDSLVPLLAEDRNISVANHATDVEIHKAILDGLKSIIEHSGETLVSGWDLTFEIMDTIFVQRKFTTDHTADEASREQSVIMTRSGRLIRSSFASLQLICSDFLSSLPNSCFLHLVDTLYKFCSQDDDLNVALTTVTFFWAISDFLSSQGKPMMFSKDMVRNSSDNQLVELAGNPEHQSSRAALWVLLLLRLTSVTTDQRLELRNSAVQTLLRIISAYGDTLGPEAWSICIHSVIFRLLASIEEELNVFKDAKSNEKDKDGWKDTAIVVIQGVSGLFASYLHVLTTHATFAASWKELLGHLATLLDFQVIDINAATFAALRDILSRYNDGDKPSFGRDTVDLAWDLWARGIPVPDVEKDDKEEDNQKCLLVWVEALLELYRLIQAELTVERVQRMLTLLHDATQRATTSAYGSDIEYVTPLQGRILEVLRIVRTDIDAVPSVMITRVAEFVSLAFDQATPRANLTQKRTYVALSKEGMAILQYLILKNSSDSDIYVSGAFSTALAALLRPIELKYQFPIVTKSTQPWKEATAAALAVLEPTLPQLRSADIPRAALQLAWHTIVSIARGIVTADCDQAPSSSDLAEDQLFDISSFHKLRELIIPALGAEAIADKTRKAYAECLFRISIVHSPTPAESAVIFGNSSNDVKGLSALYKSRAGRTIDSLQTKRANMAYVCLDELFDLVAVRDETSAPPMIQVQPPTPRFPGQQSVQTGQGDSEERAGASGKDAEDTHSLHVRLARTAAPYLILRCVLSLRAYIADQPLRGLMPQPLSQRKELARILRCLIDLRSEPEAIPDTPNVDSETRKHLLRLYPSIVSGIQVAGTAGDDKTLSLLREALDVIGGELGV